MGDSHRVRVGIGGWTYEPWRETFYPANLPKKAELHYASRQVTAIEVNGTFYRLQTPQTFAKWRDDTPDDFVFCIKAPRYIVSGRNLADSGAAILRFMESGLAELGPKLGPILWQLPATKKFDAVEIESFLTNLPARAGDLEIKHALEVRHDSFRCPEYLAIARRSGVTTVFTHDDEYPAIADLTGDFVYARLRRSTSSEPTGYAPDALATWAKRARDWASGDEPNDLPRIGPRSNSQSREVYIFFINGAKERAPAAARELLTFLKSAD